MKKVALSLILLTTIIFSINAITPSRANMTTAKVKVVPQENIFYTNTTNVGHTFKISIIAENIPDQDGGMYGWQIVLKWTPGLINCTKEEINYIWRYYMGPYVSEPINNMEGRYEQALNARDPSSPVKGTFWLVNLTFQIVKEPFAGQTLSTTLQIQPGYGLMYCLVDIDGDEIPHEFIHGVYKYISPRPPVQEAKIQVYPKAIYDPSITPCTNFSTSVTITKANFLHNITFKLSYNITILECTNISEGDFMQKFGETFMTYNIDNSLGKVSVSIAFKSPDVYAQGNGTLVTLTFHTLGFGSSPLNLYDTEILDPIGSELPHIAISGVFNNILLPVVFVDPPLMIDPTLKPSDWVQVDIKVANVSNLYSFEFKLMYDTRVLNILGALVYPFENQTNFNLEILMNDTAGEIWVRVRYYPPSVPLTSLQPLSIAKIFFQIQSYGATPLCFEQTELIDDQGKQLAHISKDGYISILKRDVAVVEIKPQYTEVYKGWKIKITVATKNLGDVPETFNVTLFLQDHVIGVAQVVTLLPNVTFETTFDFDTNQPWIMPCHNYSLKAEASGVPYEIDLTNNILINGQIHVILMGDINGDGVVNVTDATLLGRAFNSKVGDPRYDPRCDLNQDGYINVKDTIILGLNFGAHCD